jgi:hypothetical protein
MKKSLLLTLILAISFAAFSQPDTVKVNKKEGWKFGIALPAVAYDSDLGFKYGGLVNFYDYGKPSSYPNFIKSLYLEWSRTTKGSGINKFMYDDKKLFNTNLRLISDVGYYIEQNLDFYGFNGFETGINLDYTNQESSSYQSRMYYRHERKMVKIIGDIHIPIMDNMFKAVVGYSLYWMKINSVDINKLNEGKNPADQLPNVTDVPGLYEQFLSYGVIPDNQKNGGFVNHFKGGIIYDTRNLETCPTKGLWTEALVLFSPDFGSHTSYTQFSFTHRQYFTIVKNRLSLAYRMVYQTKLTGKMPFYMLPFYQNTLEVYDGFGGAKTIRGILRNRVVGEGVAFGNIELRWKFLRTKLFKQDLYLALSSFVDGGTVTKRYNYTQLSGPAVNTGTEKLHLGYGGGFRIAINENSIIAIDYGLANDKRDGNSGIYIGLNWLF